MSVGSAWTPLLVVLLSSVSAAAEPLRISADLAAQQARTPQPALRGNFSGYEPTMWSCLAGVAREEGQHYEFAPGDEAAWRRLLLDRSAGQVPRLLAAAVIADGDDDALLVLERGLRDEDSRMRLEAADAVSLIPDGVFATKPAATTCAWAFAQLIDALDRGALDASEDVAERETRSYVMRDVCRRLGASGRTDAVRALVRDLERNPTDDEACYALGDLGDAAGAAVLRQIARARPRRGEAAEYALCKLKDDEALALILARLHEGTDDTWHRRYLLEPLALLDDPAAIPALEGVAAKDDGERFVIRRVMAQLRGGDRTASLLALLEDVRDRDEYGTVDVLRDLAGCQDDRVVAAFVGVATTSRYAIARVHAMGELIGLGTRATLLASVAVMDAPFPDDLVDSGSCQRSSDEPWSAYFRSAIVGDLTARTGQHLGDDPAAWRAWLVAQPEGPLPRR